MDFWKYYGMDTLAMALSLLAVYLLGNKNKWGFIYFIASNSLWLWVGFMMDSFGIIAGNLVFLVLNTRGYLRWVREGRAVKE